MKVTHKQLRTLISEILLLEIEDDGTGTGEKAIQSFIVDELLATGKDFTREDIIQQAEGAGFESEEIDEVIDSLLDTEVVKEEEEFIVVV